MWFLNRNTRNRPAGFHPDKSRRPAPPPWRCLALAVVLVLSLTGRAGAQSSATNPPLFPFVLPWDDATPGLTDLSAWLPKPAGQFGPIHAGPDGHLYAGTNRIRFFGVDLAFSANFPRPEAAEKIAARLAKFGINMVRFHIMDMKPFPDGLLARNTPHTRDLDPEALARLDGFVAQLKRRGIYTYLCLLNYRPFNAADGLPKDIEQLGAPYQERHLVGFYDAHLLELQQEYARKLLTHRNPHTGLAYTDDPAVAFVEINNENGLIHAWLDGQVDRLPPVLLSDLKRQWNQWLRQRYASTDRLRQAWSGPQPPGTELVVNGQFADGLGSWFLEHQPGTEAAAAASDDLPQTRPGSHSACITVTRPGAESWHIRWEQAGLSVQANQAYTLTFWAKAERPGSLSLSLEQNHAPWQTLGFRTKAELGTNWTAYRFVLTASQTDPGARLIFDPPLQPGRSWVAGVSLRPGGSRGLDAAEQLEDQAVALLRHGDAGERTRVAQQDWLRFLWETEDRYWQTMRTYLAQQLKVKALLIGTIVGCSTPNLMARLDAVDTHAYWQHPVFPGRPWDPDNWVVANRSLVNEPGGVLTDLALRRVLGKPFSVTEYGHAAPNTFVSEGHLLRAAYAAFQDWDYISASRYSHQDDWDLRRIRNFFDIDQHPTKMLTLVPAAAMFLRPDVQPARTLVAASLNRERELDVLRQSGPWNLAHAGSVGLPGPAALLHRTALVVEGQTPPVGALRPDQVRVPRDRFPSDTGELVWDLEQAGRGVVTLNAPRSKAVIGYGAGKKFELGDLVVEPGPTRQAGWSALTLTVLEGSSFTPPFRALVTATGYAENTNMGWKNPEKTSVGSAWGQAPSLVEGIPAHLILACAPDRVEAWALDERGQRKSRLTVEAGAGGKARLELGPQHQTLWYEITAR